VTSDAGWYAGRRVLVTGHAGFKGTWLSAWLASGGAEVTGYGFEPGDARPSLYNESRLADRITSIPGDLRDLSRLDEALATAAPEVVFHLAAQPIVLRSYRDPLDTFETNVMGTARVLDAVRRTSGVRAVVVVTSDKCYEDTGIERPYVETDPMGGHDPYSASKGCAELVTASMRRSFLAEAGCHVATARAGNVVGGGDWSEDRLVPDLVRAVAAGEEATVRNPEAIRPWQFVLEPLRGYLMLGRRLVEDGEAFAEGWNFGPSADAAVPVGRVVELVSRSWSSAASVEAPDVTAPHESPRLRLDTTKSATRLRWTPVLGLEDTIGWTVAWYRAHHDDPDSVPQLVEQQLADYEDRVEAARSR
jgi:CDP-glucose 4,6-dehydratase